MLRRPLDSPQCGLAAAHIDQNLVVLPDDRLHDRLANVAQAGAGMRGHVYHEHVQQAIDAAVEAQKEWGLWPWHERAAVLLRAAELLTTTWRPTLNAATMLGQSKTAFQAEIDAASEMIDFWRFNPAYAQELFEEQPLSTHDDG